MSFEFLLTKNRRVARKENSEGGKLPKATNHLQTLSG